MRLQVKARQGQVKESVRRYAEEKLSKLDRRLHDLTLVDVTLSREHNPSIAADHVAEAVVHTKGPSIIARGAGITYEAAIDGLLDKLERQVERYRDKRTHETRRRSQQLEPQAPAGLIELGGEESVA
jgi:putative sigma-54 modulation protein